MQTTSNTYNAILAGKHRCEIKVTIGGIDYGMGRIVRGSCEAQLFGREVPAVGNCVSRTLNIELMTPPQKIAENAKITLWCRIRNDSAVSEWMQKGEFFVNTRSTARTRTGMDITTTIKAFDAFTLAKVKFDSSFSFPMLDRELVSAIARKIGISVKCNLGRGYQITEVGDSMTMKDALCYVAGMYGGNFTISDDGQLDLITLTKGVATQIDAESISAGDELAPITQVIVHSMDGTEYTAGNETGRNLDVDTPWATQAVADYVLSVAGGYCYHPFETTKSIVDPAIELGDTISICGVVENVYSNSIRFYSEIVADFSAPAVKEADHTYYANKNRTGYSAGKIAEEVKEVQEVAVQTRAGLEEITEYNPISGRAIAEAALYATILDNSTIPARVKSSRISTSVILSPDGTMKSLAEILADVINLNGRVNLTGSLSIRDGDLYCANNVAYFSTINAQYPDFSDASSLRLNGRNFAPRTVTLADGSTITVLAEGAVPSTQSEEGE